MFFAVGVTFRSLQLCTQFRQLTVFEFRRAGKVALAFGLLDFDFDVVHLFLDVGSAGRGGFLGFPDFVQIGVFFLQAVDFLIYQFQTFFAGVIAFFGNVHFFHFELDDAAVEFVHLLGFTVQLHFDAAGSFVNQINCFIRQEAVGNVTVAQLRCGNDSRVGNIDTVVDFITLLQTAQNSDGIFHTWLANQYFLEAAFECRIFLDVLTVFIQSSRTDTVQFATRQSRFQHIARIHCAVGFACTNQSMDFIDENQSVAIVFSQVVQNAFQAFFKFAAVFRAGNQSRQVQNQKAFVTQGFRYFAVNNTLRQAFDDGGFTHTRLTNQHRVVFGTALQYLNCTADFIITTDNRVELAVSGALSQVECVFFQSIALVFGIRIVHVLSSSYRIDRGIDILFGCTGFFQNFAGRIILLNQSQQEKFAGDIGIATFGRSLVHQVQYSLQLTARHNIATLTGYFWQAAQMLLQTLFYLRHIHTCMSQ